MSKIGYTEDKKKLIEEIHKNITEYFYPSFRATHIEFKIEFHVISPTYFKIINKVVNIGSPAVQHKYKNSMTKLFKYLIPSININGVKNDITITDEKNKFIKVYNAKINKIKNVFHELEYKCIDRQFKTIHIYSAKMNLDEFITYLSGIIKINDTLNYKVINKPNEFFEY